MKKFYFLFPALLGSFVCLHAQTDSIGNKKPSNLLSISVQPTFFRLNFYDIHFFDNPYFKFGIDFSLLYGKTFYKSWVVRTGTDFVINQGKFLIGKDKNEDQKYINEVFLRIPAILIKKFSIECSSCILDPVFFIEAGGYVSMSMRQSIYMKDPQTGLSFLDSTSSFGYSKAGLMGGLGLSFLSNNFGRHVVGIRAYTDQWLLNPEKEVLVDVKNFKPSYTAFCIYYNIANIGW